MKLNLDDINVHIIAVTLQDARDYIDGDDTIDVTTALDEAQAQVHGGEYAVSYVVIEITK